MSGYPDPNYGPLPNYGGGSGDSCANPKPYKFFNGGYFCDSITIGQSLTVLGRTLTEFLSVAGKEVSPKLFLNGYDGRYYYVLASEPLPREFIPPTPSFD